MQNAVKGDHMQNWKFVCY